MKVIPLREAKTNLSHYAKLCRREPIVVTVSGVPAFPMVPLDEDDDLIQSLIDHNPSFRRMLKARLRDRSVPAKEALRRL